MLKKAGAVWKGGIKDRGGTREGRPPRGSLWIQGALRERQGHQSEESISAGFEHTASTLPCP